jgi:NitT/TauT family transport system substrate-binding protein
MSAPEALQALVDGEIDAMFYWFPFNEMARQELGDNAANYFGIDLVPSSWVYVARTDYIEQHPEVIEKFLNAIIQAEGFYRENPEMAFANYAKYSGIEESLAASTFSAMNYQVILDQSLILDMEYQAEWFSANGYTSIEEFPNFLEFIYVDALMTVKPAAVKIIMED